MKKFVHKTNGKARNIRITAKGYAMLDAYARGERKPISTAEAIRRAGIKGRRTVLRNRRAARRTA